MNRIVIKATVLPTYQCATMVPRRALLARRSHTCCGARQGYTLYITGSLNITAQKSHKPFALSHLGSHKCRLLRGIITYSHLFMLCSPAVILHEGIVRRTATSHPCFTGSVDRRIDKYQPLCAAGLRAVYKGVSRRCFSQRSGERYWI